MFGSIPRPRWLAAGSRPPPEPAGLGWWARARPPASDLILAAVLSLLVLTPPLLLTAPLAWRRRYPIIVFGIQLLGILVADGDLRPEQSAFVALLVGVYSVAAHHRSPVVSASVLFAFGVTIAVLFEEVVPKIPGRLTAFALIVPLWLAGNSSRLARHRLDASRIRAQRAEEERDAAIVQERARIARELHDVVTHNVSVMVVQASAARQVLDSVAGPNPATPAHEPELARPREDEGMAFARGAMAAVERVGQQAMEELRYMLGVLGDSRESALSRDGDVPRGPQAGLDQLEALLQRVRHAGVPVDYAATGDARTLPAGVDLTAYRVIQEALTNVLRHAPGAATTVRVHYGPDELLVEIINEPTLASAALEPNPAGRGLAGLAERVRLYHGELVAGRPSAGGYRVTARIPLVTSAVVTW